MKAIFTLVHTTARRRAMAAVQNAPEGWVIRVSEPTRSLEQSAMIHALLTEVGDALGWKWNGTAVDLDDIKSIFVAAFRKAQGDESRFVLGIDGQPVPLSWRTRDFTKREASQFTEMVNAWLAEREAVAA